MAKPWARLQIGCLEHPKFLALSANAICLWLEGKHYCDAHHTDGFIPREALKTFRFRGRKAVELLLKSCGKKPDGESYSALWIDHTSGYVMHDYLEHNESRNEVFERINRAETSRAVDRDRLKRWRQKQKNETIRNVSETPKTETESESESESESDPNNCTSEESAAATPRPQNLGCGKPVENPSANVEVIASLIKLDILPYVAPGIDESDLAELVKQHCATKAIAFDGQTIRKAVESALFRQQLRKVMS